ncbi:MAG: beta-galactosidase [Minisyncoccia bacterium]
MKKHKKYFSIPIILFLILLVLTLAWNLLSIRPVPEKVNYGVSFSVFHSNELNLDWKKTYLAILDDLKVRNLRLTAHWPLTEPADGKYDFSELDFQINEADKRGATYILAVGRRLPGWPECHVPDWVMNQESQITNQGEKTDFENQKLLEYIQTTVERYKNSPGLKYWQVENEPFLGFFGRSSCQLTDENFFKQEIALVHKLDPTHPVLATDSGEFGYWYQAYRDGDVFGTSLYLYVWWRALGIGPLRYPIGPSFFRVKQNVVDFIGCVLGDSPSHSIFECEGKPTILIELEAEPWLLTPIVDAPMATLLDRMGIDKFETMIQTAKEAGFGDQYLWGAEWWYWMEQNGHPEFWQAAKQLFNQ